jgi:hypothetical protein
MPLPILSRKDLRNFPSAKKKGRVKPLLTASNQLSILRVGIRHPGLIPKSKGGDEFTALRYMWRQMPTSDADC